MDLIARARLAHLVGLVAQLRSFTDQLLLELGILLDQRLRA